MTIRLVSAQDLNLDVDLINLVGTVVTVVQSSQISKGTHSFELNATELKLSQGVYYLRLKVNGSEKRVKICFN